MENPKCGTCKKIWKPDETDINKKGEVYKTCKDCRIKGKNHKEKNKEKIEEKNKEYRENNKEKIAERAREYYENNKDKINQNYKNNKEKIIMENMENPENPICSKCKNIWKPDETDINKKGEVCKTCKDCRIKWKKYRENNKDKMAENQKKHKENNKEKIAERAREYYENNKEKYTENKKKYYENNQEKIKEYRKNNKEKLAEYRKNNKEKLAKKKKEYRENNKCDHNKHIGKCKICNLSLYLVNLQRTNIKRCLKVSSQDKTKSSIDYLGCDADYFVEYFKKKMDLWNENNEIKMNWDNIHIDHIKPVSSFNLDDEEELNRCCNYTNFQPLLIEDNLSKSNKWTDEDNLYWNENIKGKEYFSIYKN